MSSRGWHLPAGERLDVPSHGPAGYNRGCRCDTCRASNRERTRKQRELGVVPEGAHGLPSTRTNFGCTCEPCVEANRALVRRQHHRRQAETRDKATRHGAQWTGPELEIAARKDLTATQAALLLGRTAAAVRQQRRFMKSDPRKSRMAGVERIPGEVST